MYNSSPFGATALIEYLIRKAEEANEYLILERLEMIEFRSRRFNLAFTLNNHRFILKVKHEYEEDGRGHVYQIEGTCYSLRTSSAVGILPDVEDGRFRFNQLSEEWKKISKYAKIEVNHVQT